MATCALLEKLEALARKWERDFSGAAFAAELREIIGQRKVERRRWVQDKSSSDSSLREGYYEEEARPLWPDRGCGG